MVFRTLTFLLLFFSLSTAVAQKLTFGFNAGVNLSTVLYDAESQDAKFKLGPTAGFHFSWRLNDHLRLRIEALGERKGAKPHLNFTDENGNPISNVEVAQHLDYITVPVLLQYTFGEKKWRPFACAGGSWGFLVEETTHVSHLNSTTHHTPNFNKSDLSLLAGLGVEAPLGNAASFQIQGRTTVGLTNVGKETSLIYYSGTNLSFLLLAGVQLHIN